MVVGHDMDAMMSACFLKHLKGWRIGGFYNFETVWYETGLTQDDLRRAIWVDLDMYRNLRSIGHHILKFRLDDEIARHNQSINPNLLRGTYHGTFSQKYPLGTIHLLLWLFDETVPDSQMAKLLVWLPDSSWVNAQKYRANVQDWIENYVPVPTLLNTFPETLTANFEFEIQDILYPVLVGTGFSQGRGQIRSIHLGLGGFQCQFDDPSMDRVKIINLMSFISNVMGWSVPRVPEQYQAIRGRPVRKSYSEIRQRWGSLDETLEGEHVFSYAIPNRNRIKYTTGIEI